MDLFVMMPPMMRRAATVGACALVLAIAACEQTVPEGSNSPSAPPADAAFLEEGFGPEGMASTVWMEKTDDARKKAADQWAGMWIPEPGWVGTVEKVEEKGTGTNVWFMYPASPIVGGHFWVAAEFPGLMERLTPARDVFFTGRIEKVEVLKPTGAPEIRIVVRNAKMLNPGGK